MVEGSRIKKKDCDRHNFLLLFFFLTEGGWRMRRRERGRRWKSKKLCERKRLHTPFRGASTCTIQYMGYTHL